MAPLSLKPYSTNVSSIATLFPSFHSLSRLIPHSELNPSILPNPSFPTRSLHYSLIPHPPLSSSSPAPALHTANPTKPPPNNPITEATNHETSTASCWHRHHHQQVFSSSSKPPTKSSRIPLEDGIVMSSGYTEDVRPSNIRLLLGIIIIAIALVPQFYPKKLSIWSMDLEMLPDRASDAINTIIRRDEAAQSGDFLPLVLKS
ncbi:putative signal peptidase complex subunit 2 [Cinnamomum micranthum f. kanehirae]|uniref:Putative signal peptidase complex subunit 2 n=1 Tax=Cinnamomum micranthum f. kanehirae TaxID=337451 RepID=A0A3S3P0I9_9MAGN|nr:putative signal peptidase complex subunit 2 [Cinnamomum micranthum f. kanehirae]